MDELGVSTAWHICWHKNTAKRLPAISPNQFNTISDRPTQFTSFNLTLLALIHDATAPLH